MNLLSLFHKKELKKSWLQIFPSNRFHKNFHVSCMENSNRNQWREARKVCIVFDNALLHINEAVICCYKELGARWIWIPPYSPQLNPTEKLIAKIKVEIFKQSIKKTAMNLNMIKKIVDSITQRDCYNIICSSRKEWMIKILEFELFI